MDMGVSVFPLFPMDQDQQFLDEGREPISPGLFAQLLCIRFIHICDESFLDWKFFIEMVPSEVKLGLRGWGKKSGGNTGFL